MHCKICYPRIYIFSRVPSSGVEEIPDTTASCQFVVVRRGRDRNTYTHTTHTHTHTRWPTQQSNRWKLCSLSYFGAIVLMLKTFKVDSIYTHHSSDHLCKFGGEGEDIIEKIVSFVWGPAQVIARSLFFLL